MKIVKYSPEKPGAFGIARFDVELDPHFFQQTINLHRFRLVKSKKGTLYFTEPPYCVDDELTGEKKWVKYYSFGDDDKKRLESEILPLLEPFYRSNSSRSPGDDGCFPVDF